MRSIFFAAMLLTALAATGAALAQQSKYENIGRTPTADEVRAWDIAVGPEGKELPPGSGTAKDGAKIFAQKCVACHGPTLEGTRFGPALVGGEGTLTTLHPSRTIGAYWPFATTIWDYIDRAMPRDRPRSLSADEVYSLTAFLLFRSGIVKEDAVIDAKTLPKIQMPNRNNFIPQQLDEISDLQKRGCKAGHCP